MKNETIPTLTLPKIGFGTWSIGGSSTADPKLDSASMKALRSAMEIGYTHFDTAEYYASGHSEELLGRAVRETNTKREDVFITSKVSPSHLKYNDVLAACEKSLRHLNMDYIDLYLIHWPGTGVNYEETFRALNKLVHDGKVRHLGVSNFDLKLLKLAQSLSETPIVNNQVPYSISDRSYVKNGMLEYCQKNDIILTAYSPVDEGRLKVKPTLRSIAEAHGATPYQIALAWLTSQSRVISIPMSFNPEHIKENFESGKIELTQSEIEQLTNF